MHFLWINYASHQIMHGVPHLHVLKWMGHKEPETLLRYVHISPGTNHPSIFAEKDIYALLDEKPKEEPKVIPMTVQNDSGSAKTGG
ncbi:MAG TPA: hypothetical protein VMU54_14350 [Planctomycetota bacterium]|nr:hypothetical protein [Planctomycetota bacterium]